MDTSADPAVPFSGSVAPEIKSLLQQAAAAYRDAPSAETLLRQARALDETCLPVYFSLYKFLFYRRRLSDAEGVAREALAAAARLGAFAADWRTLRPDSTDWSGVNTPQHFFLFTLKALAFITLRRGGSAESRALLAKLAELDPNDRVGACVIASLLPTMD